MKINTEVLIYFASNIFSAGVFYRSRSEWAKGYQEWLMLLIQTVGIMFLGFPLAIVVAFLGSLIWLYHKIVIGLHLQFIVKYVILKRPLLGYSDVKFKVMKASAKGMQKTMRWYKFGDKVYIKLVAWISAKYEKGGANER